MRAARWHAAGDLRVEDVAEPGTPERGAAIVRVRLAAICASDLAEYRNGPHAIPVERPHPLTGRKAPLTLGHEYVGDVVAVGPDVTTISSGERVCGDACIRCGTCFWCMRGEYNICRIGGSVGLHSDGAFADFLEVPAYTLVKVPAGVPDWQAALTEPLAVGLHATRKAEIAPGDTVVVAGLGMVGAASLLMARRGGAAAVFVLEPNPRRRKLALAMGATAVIDPNEPTLVRRVRSLTDGIGADVVLDCTGKQEFFPTLLDCARRGGRIVVAGIGNGRASLDLNRIVHFERRVTGALGYRYEHTPVLRMLVDGLPNSSLLESEPISLEDIVARGFDRMIKDPDVPIRVFVDPSGRAE
jgi:(R,R)-butanediol dehydrogenase / meso-butanediol dehydrogenase / diacetyl reductase